MSSPLRRLSAALVGLLLLLAACQSKSSKVLAEREFAGVSYQLVENIDANIKLTHRDWVLRKGDQDVLVITGYDLINASLPERSDVPYVEVKQARGGSGFPSLLLLPEERFQEEDLPRLAELLSDPTAWQSEPDAIDIVIGGLLRGDAKEYTLRYEGTEGGRALTVDVYGVVMMRKSDGTDLFVGRVAEGGKTVPIDSPELPALEQAEPGGLSTLAGYKDRSGASFGSRFSLVPPATGMDAPTSIPPATPHSTPNPIR